MDFYTIIKTSDIDLNEIENSLLEWKINNIITYLSMITYENDQLITFCFDISNDIYNLKIIYIKDRWILEFNQNIDNFDKIHLMILNMINDINLVENNDKLPYMILNIIELKIDETDFNDINIDKIIHNQGFNFNEA